MQNKKKLTAFTLEGQNKLTSTVGTVLHTVLPTRYVEQEKKQYTKIILY